MSSIRTHNLNVYYGAKHALFDVNISMPEKSVTALIGPSGCGKSTFLRCINRMNDTIDGCRVEGKIMVEDRDINAPAQDVVQLRSWIGMVFQKPNPFPKSIYDNVAYGPRIHNLTQNASELDQLVEQSLVHAGLWNEVKDRLHDAGTSLSGGQQQRLCIARTLAVNPEIILMDEPCSALDPIATGYIEDLMHEIKTEYTIVIVTHNMQQAARVSDQTAFFYEGHLVEAGATTDVFTKPRQKQTEEYITGRFG